MPVLKSTLGLFAPLLEPIRIAIFALIGAGLAALWVSSRGAWAIGIVGALIILTVVAEVVGRALMPKHPIGALGFFEVRIFGIGATAAAATAATILFGIGLTAADNPTKALLSSIAATLGALVAAITVKPDASDAAVGTAIKKIFYASYNWMDGDVQDPGDAKPQMVDGPGRSLLFPKKSSAIQFVYDNAGIPDWTRPNRWIRARGVATYIKKTKPAAPSRAPV